MTDCPCWGQHVWTLDDYFVKTGYCAFCDCHEWCEDCEGPRPPRILVHQCMCDPK